MIVSDNIKHRFIKDFNLPIVVYDYFDYFMALYDNIFKTFEKYSMLFAVLRDHPGEDFFKLFNTLKDDIIKHVSSKESYKELQAANLGHSKVLPKGNIFNEYNDGKTFVSLDLKKANFQALKYFNPELVDNCVDYETFIRQFTNYDYFIQSKKLRQIIFGNLNPKRQQAIQRKIMAEFIDEWLYDNKNIISASSDEIIIAIEDEKYADVMKSDVIGIELHTTFFKLKHLKPHSFFVREFPDGTFDFKCVPAHFFAQVYKYYTKQGIEERDLTFYFEGKKARFIEPLTFTL